MLLCKQFRCVYCVAAAARWDSITDKDCNMTTDKTKTVSSSAIERDVDIVLMSREMAVKVDSV